MKISAFLKRILFQWLTGRLISTGFSPYTARQLARLRVDDFLENRGASLAQKIWAQKRGFLSVTAEFYGFNEGNFKDYLSDFDYFSLHPISGFFSRWIDDKLTVRYILGPFSEYLPAYYYHFYNKDILRLVDCPEGFPATKQGVLDLLFSRQVLAAKMVSGSEGEGFYKLAHDGKAYSINDRPSSAEAITQLIENWLSRKKDYIITEYFQSHRDLQKIFPGPPGVVRVILFREMNLPPKVLSAYINFPTSKTGTITNAPQGGVGCMVDIDNGYYSDGKTVVDGKLADCPLHPDTNILLEGFLPNWDLVKQKVVEIARYTPQIRWMGLDVIITEEGFKVIEINSLPGISFIQYNHPLLIDGNCKQFFKSLLEEKGRGSRG